MARKPTKAKASTTRAKAKAPVVAGQLRTDAGGRPIVEGTK